MWPKIKSFAQFGSGVFVFCLSSIASKGRGERGEEREEKRGQGERERRDGGGGRGTGVENCFEVLTSGRLSALGP